MQRDPFEPIPLDQATVDELTGGGDTDLHYHSSDRDRANHTGTQTASTISDFSEAAQDAVLSVFADSTSLDVTYDDNGNAVSATVIGKHDKTGMDYDSTNVPTTTLTYNETTRTVSIAPIGASFDLYIQGVKHTKTAQSLAHAATGAAHFFYFDETGTFVTSETPWDLFKHAPVAFVFQDTINNRRICFEERHHAGRDVYWHHNQHFAEGTKAPTGFTTTSISGYTLATGTDAACTFTLASGTLADEDIEVQTEVVPDNGPYVIMERSGASGTWAFTRTNVVPFKRSGTNLQYNQNTGATWQLTTVANGDHVNYWVFGLTALPQASVTPAPGAVQQIVILPGQTKHTNLAGANAETVASIDWGTFPFQEVVPLYRLTYKYASAAGGTVSLEAISRIIGTNATITAGASSSDHGSLTGLLDDDHLQYLLASDVTSRVAFLAAWTDLTDGGDSVAHYHSADRSRANHTGTQTSGTISDLTEFIQDTLFGTLVAGTNISFSYDDTANTFTINATAGGGVTDHGALTGLLDDDHTQYVLTTGARDITLTGANSFDVAGATTAQTVLNLTSGLTHASPTAAFIGSTITISGTTQGIGLYVGTVATGAGASLSTLFGAVGDSYWNGTVPLTNFIQLFSRLNLGAASSGTVSNFYGLQVASPNYTGGTTATVTNYNGVLVQNTTQTHSFAAAFRGQMNAGTGKWNLYMDGTALNYLNGQTGIGAGPDGVSGLLVGTTALTLGANSRGLRVYPTLSSAVTASYRGVQSIAETAAAAFTLADFIHFDAFQNSLGAGSSITNQYAFFVSASLIGATANYGLTLGNAAGITAGKTFYGIRNLCNIATGGGSTWFIYSDGTAPSFHAGDFGVGFSPVGSGAKLTVAGNATGGVARNGLLSYQTIQSDITTSYNAVGTFPTTQATAFTLGSLRHFNAVQATFGAGSIVTEQIGFRASGLVSAVNNYGFVSELAAAANTYNFYASGTAKNLFIGDTGIGNAGVGAATLTVQNNATGATTRYGIINTHTVQSGVTALFVSFPSTVATAAAAFTLADLRHFNAAQGTFGAGSAVTAQYGFLAGGDLVGATTNTAFYAGNAAAITAGKTNYAFRSQSNIATGGGTTWNLYLEGTANNYIAGSLGIGSTSLTEYNLRVAKNITGATTAYAVSLDALVQSGVTSTALGFNTGIGTAAASFSTSIAHFRAIQGTFGAGSTVNNQYGFIANSTLIGATNNYSFYASNTAAVTTGKTSYGYFCDFNIATGGGTTWALYFSGTALSAINGSVRIGSTAAPGQALDVTGQIRASNLITCTGSGASGGVGYGIGAGGSATQLTNKATGVTINAPAGQITMNNAALAANTTVSFTLTCSSIFAVDVVSIHRKSGGTAASYQVWVDSIALGSCVICVRNITAGSLSEAVVLQYAVIKGSNA